MSASPFGPDADTVLDRIAASRHPVVHLSDALRLAVVHDFGGWYADIDTVFLRPLTDFDADPNDLISTDGNIPSSFGRASDDHGTYFCSWRSHARYPKEILRNRRFGVAKPFAKHS